MGGKSGLVNRTKRLLTGPVVGTVNERVREMFVFAAERHRMEIRKKRGDPYPWTDNAILNDFHFCNIFRELDKTTIWIKRQFLGAHPDHPNLLFAACLARRINYPPTLEEVGFPLTWDPEQVIRIMRDRMARNDKTFNPNAYRMVGGQGLGGDMIGFVINNLLGPIWRERATWPTTFNGVQDAVRYLVGFDGWGPMVSYHVALDIVGFSPLAFPADQDTWTNVGPGGIRGLNRIFGRPLEAGLTNARSERLIASCLEEIRWLQEEQKRHWPQAFPRLLLCDIENCLCEYDKFMRIVDGQLTGQRKYNPFKETWSGYKQKGARRPARTALSLPRDR